MFDYEAPIKIIMQEMQALQESQVCQAVQNIGVDVDKEELLKALSYDRNQYAKGYRAAKNEIIHCKDCRHYVAEYCTRDIKSRTNMFYMRADDFCSYGERKDEK